MKRILLVVFVLLAAVVALGIVRDFRGVRPEISSFTATPRTVHAGEAVTMAWTTRGIESVAMSWGPELNPRDRLERQSGLPPMGTMTMRPMESTIYVLECESKGGEVCISGSVTVRVR